MKAGHSLLMCIVVSASRIPWDRLAQWNRWQRFIPGQRLESEETAVCCTTLETIPLRSALQERLLCSGILMLFSYTRTINMQVVSVGLSALHQPCRIFITISLLLEGSNSSERCQFSLLVVINHHYYFFFRLFFRLCLCALPWCSVWLFLRLESTQVWLWIPACMENSLPSSGEISFFLSGKNAFSSNYLIIFVQKKMFLLSFILHKLTNYQAKNFVFCSSPQSNRSLFLSRKRNIF